MNRNWLSDNEKLGEIISLLAGVCLVGLAFYAEIAGAAFWCSVSMGGLIAVLSALAVWRKREEFDWLRMAAGIWAAFIPWIFFMEVTVPFLAVQFVFSILAIAFPVWRRWRDDGGNSALKT
ncbi:hypothetical protein V6767_05125 [Martelella sp. FLE1502]|tara:strand:- start:10503 stop:10865 length:363 start_codon:yes stop_codon:yes gene_type:complete